ncbi:hypothetical protein AB0933_31605 [Streptomyces venezuelae]|uniref:hypothetical protein n=1 Tax=Streptomyces venezuelae TaxID=54571 RepID=UPI0034512CD7
MHHHGYVWTGPKQRYDDEALRRPPPPHPPPDGSRPDLVLRHREVKAEFPTVDLPPLETAYWLIKPEKLVRGTWEEPKEAADWLGERLGEYATLVVDFLETPRDIEAGVKARTARGTVREGRADVQDSPWRAGPSLQHRRQ